MARTPLSALGSILADETRSEILCALMDGRAHTGGELARFVGVAPSTASEHLSKLLDAGLLAVEPQGRHRYFRLAGAEVAALLERIGTIEIPTTPLPPPRAPAALVYARTCYRHLAGTLAVQIYDGLLEAGHIEPFEDKLNLMPSGEILLHNLGVDVDDLRRPRQATVRPCLDWTQRRHHLAGRAANAMLDALFEHRWIVRDATARSIRVTNAGRAELFAFFDIPVEGQAEVVTGIP